MGPTWVLSAPDGPHVGPMNLAIRAVIFLRVVGVVTAGVVTAVVEAGNEEDVVVTVA